MEQEEIIDKVQERVHEEWLKYVNTCEEELSKEEIIRNAYEIAHYNEIDDFFDSIDVEYPPFDISVFERMLNYDGNIIDRIWNSWLNYGHSERYNFFCYEDLVDIILWAFKN